MRPIVSICVPAFEQPVFLKRCLGSIFAQDFDDFEVIVTDDSVSDAVENVVKEWIKDNRLQYHRNNVRLGSPANWNRAMTFASSDLIKFLHHDDWFTTTSSLRRFVNAINLSTEVMFAFSAANACEDNGEVIFLHQPKQGQVEKFIRDPVSLQYANFIGAPSATIFRRIPGFEFDPQLKWVVDIDAYLRIMGSHPCCTYISEPLVSISSNGVHQITNDFYKDSIARTEEHLYMYAKHTPKNFYGRLRGLQFIKHQLDGCGYSDLKFLSLRRAKRKRTIEERLILNTLKLKTSIKATISHLRKRFFGKKSQEIISKVSYSQCGEDMICDFLFSWLGISQIIYLDIGAHDSKWLSNTYYFYERGFSGVLIEPDEDLCVGLRRERPRDKILNLAVAAYGNDTVDMYVMTSRTLNTLDRAQANQLAAGGREKIEDIRSVRLLGINEILKEQFGSLKPNLISLDIEGLDFEILSAWNFETYRPEVFCVETLTYTQDNSERKLKEIIELMKSKGYQVYADTFVNTIFVSEEAWQNRPIYN